MDWNSVDFDPVDFDGVHNPLQVGCVALPTQLRCSANIAVGVVWKFASGPGVNLLQLRGWCLANVCTCAACLPIAIMLVGSMPTTKVACSHACA